MLDKYLNKNEPCYDTNTHQRIEEIGLLITFMSTFEDNSTIHNQYSEKLQAHNLKEYLIYHTIQGSPILILGEAAGYKGCQFSGIPFTSGNILANHKMFSRIKYKYFTFGIEKRKENSSHIMYEFYSRYPSAFNDMVMFNSFPFHPFKLLHKDKNRSLTKDDLFIGRQYLVELIRIFNFQYIIPIGRKALKMIEILQKDGTLPYFNPTPVRHPSFGGKKEFIAELSKIYEAICKKEVKSISDYRKDPPPVKIKQKRTRKKTESKPVEEKTEDPNKNSGELIESSGDPNKNSGELIENTENQSESKQIEPVKKKKTTKKRKTENTENDQQP